MANKKSKAKKAAKKHPKIVIAVVILLVIIIAAIAVLWYFKPEVFEPLFELINTDNGYNNSTDKGNGTNNGNDTTNNGGTNGSNSGSVNLATGSEADITNADLSIHFLELGNKYAGDSILIKCGDTEVLIDAGSRQGSATTLCEYINQYCTDGVLEYVISTHADQDHIAAFYGNSSNSTRTGILYQYEIGTFIKFDLSDSTSQIYKNYLTAVDYIESNGTNVYTASQCYEQKDGAQRQYYLDDGQTISINILYNYYYYNSSSDENNYSVVMLLTQELEDGNKYYLFTGDLEEDGESRLVDYYANVPAEYATEYNILPEVELYKAGHHGSKTSSTIKLLDVIKPKYVAVCCCAGSPEYTTNNNNTFPTQQMIDNVSKYTDQIFVTTLATDVAEVVNGVISSTGGYGFTSMNGNIVFYTSGGELKLYCSNNYTILKDTEWFQNNRTWNS